MGRVVFFGSFHSSFIVRLVTVTVEEDQINTLTCSPGAFIRQINSVRRLCLQSGRGNLVFPHLKSPVFISKFSNSMIFKYFEFMEYFDDVK